MPEFYDKPGKNATVTNRHISILYILLDFLYIKTYFIYSMSKIQDKQLIERFTSECARRGFTLEEMGAAIGRTKGWASQLVNGKTKRPGWRTQNEMRRFLGEI